MNEIITYAAAAAAILAVLFIALIALRTFRGRSFHNRKGRRIGIVDHYNIDNTRRLLLVRRDNVEHLVLVGGENDLVVESGITKPDRAERHAPRRPRLPASKPAPELAEEPRLQGEDAEYTEPVPFAPRSGAHAPAEAPAEPRVPPPPPRKPPPEPEY